MRKAFAGGRFGTTYGSPPYRVLALPGWMHTAADFDAVLGGLAEDGVGSVGLDLPGFGGLNPEPPAVWGAAEYAEWVAPVLDELDDRGAPVVIAGHSRGGAVAVCLAAGRPERVAGLVLAGVPLLRRSSSTAAKPARSFRVARALHRRGLLPDARMEAMRRRHGSADYRNARGVMRDILVKVTNESYERELGMLRGVPVELVWGEHDTAAPVEVAERAATMLGERATLTVVPDVGHQVPTDAPGALRTAIERLLSGTA